MTKQNYQDKYDDWNKALANYFYNEAQAEKPVYLQVDDDILSEIAQEIGIPKEDGRKAFIAAVRHRARLKEDPFFRFFSRVWQNNIPPFIAFLGLCVLAAFDMDYDDEKGVSSANYYDRLKDLLGVKRPKRFDDVGELWERLNQWLDKDHEQKLGKATASYITHRHVGYPISQALMRMTDRQKLPDFFVECKLKPEQEWVTPEYFKHELVQLATKTTWPFSNRVWRIFEKQDDDAMTLVARIVHAEYGGWDGRSTEQIRMGFLSIQKIALQLEINYDGFECTLYPCARSKSGEQFPEGVYQSFQTIKLRRDPYLLNWFTALPDYPFLMEFFAEKELGLQSLDRRFRQQISPASIMLFREDSDGELGSYVRYDGQPILRETYQIVCHNRLRNLIETYLTKHGQYSEILTSDNPIYKNWVCFRDARLVNRQEVVNEALTPLIPAKIGLSLRRKGGLKLGRDKYLLGGEPEVEITADDEHETTVYIDDKPYKTFSAESLIIDLRELGWQNGGHTIRLGENGRNYSFYIVASGTESQQPFQPLAHPIIYRESKYHPDGLDLPPLPAPETYELHHLYISGAQLKGNADDLDIPIVRPVRVPYGKPRCIILGRRIGDILETYLPTGYSKWEVQNLGWSNGIYVTVRFKPQWIICIKGNQKVLKAVDIPDDPIIPDTITGDKEKWVQWARKNYPNIKQHALMWERYRHLAEHI
ncbi:MAG: hypothetical protein OT477_00155 [Chloroflexi bacterium]|nr:hypothetical protein [Chloroflexota bacterium]